MNREQKTATIEDLKSRFAEARYFYLTDCSALTVEKINKLRRTCFEKGVQLQVVKNTLIRKALEQVNEAEYSEIFQVLHGPTAVMFCETGNIPAKLIKEFRETSDKPVLKGAYIDSAIYIGDEQLDSLVAIKSKDELLGELIGLLQSPMANLLGALQSGQNTIGGLLKALEEREGDAA